MLGSEVYPLPFIYNTNRQGTKHATPRVDTAPQGVKTSTLRAHLRYRGRIGPNPVQ